jgi:hypothetical protein
MIKIASLPTIAAAFSPAAFPVLGSLSYQLDRRPSRACSAKSRRTIIASSNIGVLALSNPGTVATAVMLRNSVASNNGTAGLVAQRNAVLRVAHSVVTGNNTGVSVSAGGKLFSYGDNDIDGNTTDNTGILTVIPKH